MELFSYKSLETDMLKIVTPFLFPSLHKRRERLRRKRKKRVDNPCAQLENLLCNFHLPAKTALFPLIFIASPHRPNLGRLVNATRASKLALKTRKKIFGFFGQSELRKRSILQLLFPNDDCESYRQSAHR